MKKLIFVLTITCFYANAVSAQVIKVNGGLSLSSLDLKNYPDYNDNLSHIFVSAGLDYWDHKYWYLSSEVGYLKKGGKETFLVRQSMIDPGTSMDINNGWNILQINTTFRGKIPIASSHTLILGAGPAFDFIMGHDKREFSPNKVSFGLKLDAGYETMINERFKLGLIYSFNRSLTPFGKSAMFSEKGYNQTSLISAVVGYRL